MNTKQKLSILCVVLAGAIAGLWVTKGMHLATPEKIQKEVVSTDEFGDKVTKKEWVANPDKLEIGLDYAGPGIGLFMGLAGVLFWLGYKENQ